jgi:predicted RND superfamily exporter protein
MMPHKMNSYQKMMEYSGKFNAGQSGVILVNTSSPGGILEPDFLEKLDEMEKILNTGVENTSAYSIVDVIKRMNAGRVPRTREDVKRIVDNLPEQYKVMMLTKDEEGKYLYNKTLIYVEMPIMPLDKTQRGVAAVNQITSQYNDDVGVNNNISQLAGLAAITVELNQLLMDQQLRFMFISLILVYLCLLLVFRSFRYASFTMVPIILLLVWQPGIFVLLGIPLNISTMTVSSIVIGVGIDFAVHITERVREEVKTSSGLRAIKIALSRKTPSLVEATVALVGGSLSIFLMEYEMISQFIIMVLVMLAVACLASVLTLASFYSIRNGKLLEELR